MKIIHTSDWHIGKIVNEYSMIDDQKYILNKLIELIDEENIDVLMIAGDVYDRSIPPVEAVELLNETLSKLIIDRNVSVMIISGNHDSGERLSFGSKILEKQGLYIAGSDDKLYKKVVLRDNNQNVNFYLVPYKDPALTKKLLNNKEIRSHNDAMIAVIDKIKEELNENEINILIGHGYVTMKREEAIEGNDHKYEVAELQTSESERPLSIGGTDLIDGNIYKDFDYVALGHLHGRQRIGRDTMRYSGSLLKYSFSEVKQKKSVAVLDLIDKDINVELKELKPLRDLRIIKGNIEDLICEGRDIEEGKEDYIQAILTDDGELMNPMEKLKSVYPNTMLISRERKKNVSKENTLSKGEFRKKSKIDLFKNFYEAYGSGEYNYKKEAVYILPLLWVCSTQAAVLIRFWIAVGWLLISLHFYLNRFYVKSVILFMIAVATHTSIILFLPIILICSWTDLFRKKKVMMIIFIAATVLLDKQMLGERFVMPLADFVSKYISNERLTMYNTDADFWLSGGRETTIALNETNEIINRVRMAITNGIILFLGFDIKNKYKNGVLLFNLTALGLIFYNTVQGFELIDRYISVLNIFIAFILSFIITEYQKHTLPYKKYVFWSLIVFCYINLFYKPLLGTETLLMYNRYIWDL